MNVCAADDCNNTFAVADKGRKRKYCCSRCRMRQNKRNAYAHRRELSLCLQCGKNPVDLSIHTYCDDCYLYFRQNYLLKKERKKCKKEKD